MTVWADEVETLKELSAKGVTLEEIGNKYNVTRQRMYQVFTKYNIETTSIKRKNFLKGKGPAVYWLSRILLTKKIPKDQRLEILEKIQIPENCPMLGIKLNYDGVESQGWSRTDSSPSVDRIDSNKGYTLDNIHVISWRANRIKNDSTPEELEKIAAYMKQLTK